MSDDEAEAYPGEFASQLDDAASYNPRDRRRGHAVGKLVVLAMLAPLIFGVVFGLYDVLAA
jgi:hypothetical protein